MTSPRREQSGLVDEVRQVGPDHARSRGGDSAQVDIRAERDRAGVYLEDLLSALAVGRLNGDATVEPARAEQGLVEHVGPVRGCDHDHAGRRVEPVHLGEDLVQGLLPLVVAAAEAGRAGGTRAADRVELVDEHDGGRGRLCLREEVADAGCADADDRFDELGCGQREERHSRLARDRAGEERLPGPGRAAQKDPVGDPAAEPKVFLRAAKEVDDLGELVLRLIDPRDVREGDGLARGNVAASARPSEGPEHPLHVAPAAHQPEEQAQEEQRRPEAQERLLPPGPCGRERLRVQDHVLALQNRRELIGVGERRDLRLEVGRRFRPVVGLGMPKLALDRRSLRGDLADVAARHLLQEVGAVGDTNAGRCLRRPGAEPDIDHEQSQREGGEPPTDREARLRRRRGRAVTSTGRRTGRAGLGRACDVRTMPESRSSG